MGQINVTADDKLMADIDRLAGALGVSRPESIRVTLREAINALDAGRLAFAAQEGPKLDASLSSLVAQLREANVEVDRTNRENAKIAKRLIDSWNGGEEAIRAADKRLTDRINIQLREGYAPFRADLAGMKTMIEALPQSATELLAPQMAAIDQKLSENRKVAMQPRTANYYALSDEWHISATVLTVVAGAIFIIGCVCGSWFSGPDEQHENQPVLEIVPTPASACNVVNYVFKTKDCRIPEAARKRAVDALSQEPRP